MWDFILVSWPVLGFIFLIGIPFLVALVRFIVAIFYTPKRKKKR